MGIYDAQTSHLNMQEFGACALVQDLLPLYLEGEVTPGSREVIIEHLSRCERCASYLAGAQSMRGQLRRNQAIPHIPPARPAGTASRAVFQQVSKVFRQRAERTGQRTGTPDHDSRSRPMAGVVAKVAGALMLIILTAAFISSMGHSSYVEQCTGPNAAQCGSGGR